jgi:arylsulfatase
MPTFAEITGATLTETDGISILPTLKGKKQRGHEYLYWEFPENKGQIAIRVNNWKGLIQNVKNGNNRMELFDLNSDPQELYNLADENPDIIKRMENIIKEAHIRSEIEKFRFPFDN